MNQKPRAPAHLTPRQRELILRLSDGQMATLPILYHFINYRRCNDIFQWLLSNGFTGNNLIALVNREFGNQMLNVVKFILMKIDKDRVMKPLFLGKDYLAG
jgi:hypothetical protein